MSEPQVLNDVQGAREALYRFCKGKERMCVPARPDDDDALIADALDELETLKTAYNEAITVMEKIIKLSEKADKQFETRKGASFFKWNLDWYQGRADGRYRPAELVRDFLAKHKEANP